MLVQSEIAVAHHFTLEPVAQAASNKIERAQFDQERWCPAVMDGSDGDHAVSHSVNPRVEED